jgi:hypothetical protein
VTAQGLGAVFGSISYWAIPVSGSQNGFTFSKGDHLVYIEIKAATRP